MPNNPIQVILERERFHVLKEIKPSPRGTKDFYANEDDKFRAHKRIIIDRVERARSILQRQSADIGYAKVRMRPDALAKAHRPFEQLFLPEATPAVGSDALGEILVEVTSATLTTVASRMARAEEETRIKFDEYKQKNVFNPSREKQELGAISGFGLISAEDRVHFSVRDALKWLADPRTGGSYRVELFRMPPQRAQWDTVPEHLRLLYRSFASGLLQFAGLECDRLDLTNKYNFWLKVRLSNSGAPAYHPFGSEPPARAEYEVTTTLDASEDRHAALLQFLGTHPLVRRVHLAPRLEPSRAQGQPSVEALVVPRRSQTGAYPLVGVVDGGVAPCLDEWVIDRRDILAPQHRDLHHGTFIGGLLVGAGSFNPSPSVRWESDGCDLIDVSILPDQDDPAAASAYGGVDGFLGEFEQAVYLLRTRHNVRVFNISTNTIYPSEPDDYSYEAQKLDEIADQNDVIIVQSAGNLGVNARSEWSIDEMATLTDLAGSRDPLILAPAESIRNISVAALNQPGLPNVVANAPASYSRRGPGLRCGVKPDVAHYGGASSSGLRSLSADGGDAVGFGTSYATPLIAKTLACLDAKIEGEVSRETLVALLVHHARILPPLTSRAFRHLARDFVGFGIPADSETILNGPDSSITLVFAGRLGPRQIFQFELPWPPLLVSPQGACRGAVRMTLVATPPLHHEFKSEIARVNLDVALQQSRGDGRWKGYPNDYQALQLGRARPALFEAELIKEALKWSPIKVYEHTFKKGVGKSSTWRLEVDALARANDVIPTDGVPFTVLLTIADPENQADVFNNTRATLQRSGIRISDIQTAARITPRI